MGIILMRHTQTALGKAYCYGRADVALADSFTADIAAAIAKLPKIDRIISSPLSRARLLADRIAAQRALQIAVDDRVQEMDFGTWETRLWSSIPRAELDAWAADFMDARPHGGESVRQLQKRCRSAIADHAAAPGDTLIVCHAGVARAVYATGESASDFQTSLDYGEAKRWQQPDVRPSI